MNRIRVIAFDADDTLWDNQSWYDKAENVFTDTLKQYGTADELSEILFHTESGNMAILGYGAKAVCISMMETALKIAGGNLSPSQMDIILKAAKSLLEIPATPLPGVVETLDRIRSLQKYRMILLTKGDMLDQQNKLRRSGLERFFDRIVIVSNKGRKEYLDLCEEENISPESLCMVGNSFKSDILPVIGIGGRGVHIPFHTMWRHEVVEEFDHPDVLRLNGFCELYDALI